MRVGITKRNCGLTLAALILATPLPAMAGEAFGGVYKHDASFLRDVLSIIGTDPKNYESGIDYELGWRSEPVASWEKLRSPRIYVMVQVNDSGNTSQADVGLTWTKHFGQAKKLYVRPGIGLAIHDGRLHNPDPNEVGITPDERARRLARAAEPKKKYSSRIMFNPQFAVGYELSRRTSLELSWVHMSHAGLGGEVNQGQDNLGVRFNYRY